MTLRDGWFNACADFLGTAYLRNAFTLGTKQEVDYLIAEGVMRAGSRVLDVGCGPGRHSLEIARRGIETVGVDLSSTFVELARQSASAERLNATFEICDVRTLDFEAEFDALICLCQGGFGLLGGAESAELLAKFARAVRPGGRLALSAFSSYFAVRWLETSDDFDVVSGVNHELATLRNAAGDEREFDLWTTCFTARELRLLAELSGWQVDAIAGVKPGSYRSEAPSFSMPELLLLATRL